MTPRELIKRENYARAYSRASYGHAGFPEGYLFKLGQYFSIGEQLGTLVMPIPYGELRGTIED